MILPAQLFTQAASETSLKADTPANPGRLAIESVETRFTDRMPLPGPHGEIAAYWRYYINQERPAGGQRPGPVIQRHFGFISTLRLKKTGLMLVYSGDAVQQIFGNRAEGADLARYVGTEAAARLAEIFDTTYFYRRLSYITGTYRRDGQPAIRFAETIMPLGMGRMPTPTFLTLTTFLYGA